MDKIIEILISALLLVFAFTVCRYAYKRAAALKRIGELGATASARITKCRHPLSSYFKLSGEPDLIVEIGKRIYFVRFLNGRGANRYMHFASREYFVTYSKMRFSIGNLTSLRARRGTASTGSLTTGAHSVKILPPLLIPDEYVYKRDIYGAVLEPVLILNPAPNEVSYVTEKKTSIKVAFTGDEIHGQRIFTASSFASYAERIFREDKIYGN